MTTQALDLRRQPIRVRLRPPNGCTAALCDTPAAGCVVWLAPGWGELRSQAACLAHLTWAKSIGGCLVFPASAMPPFDVLAAQVQAEINRRISTPVRFGAATIGGFTGTWTTVNFTTV